MSRTVSDLRPKNNPVFRFVGLFVILLGGFQVLYYTVVISSAPFKVYIDASAQAAAALLTPVDPSVTVSDGVLQSDFAMSVRHGCDGLQAMAIFIVGVIAFPGGFVKKLPGIAVGVGLLVMLNVIRIASLFWVGIHKPDWFQSMHIYAWPAFLVFCALACWTLWAMWATRVSAAE